MKYKGTNITPPNPKQVQQQLDFLYMRKTAVIELIRSLEQYDRSQKEQQQQCGERRIA